MIRSIRMAGRLPSATSALHTDTMLFDEEILLKGLDVYKPSLGLGVDDRTTPDSLPYIVRVDADAVLLLLPVIAVSIGVMFVLAGLAAAALVLFITAIGVTVWLCRSREQRRADGKTNVGWVVFLIIAYLSEHQLPGVLCPDD